MRLLARARTSIRLLVESDSTLDAQHEEDGMNQHEGTPNRRRTESEDEQQISMEGSAILHEADEQPGTASDEVTRRDRSARPEGGTDSSSESESLSEAQRGAA